MGRIRGVEPVKRQKDISSRWGADVGQARKRKAEPDPGEQELRAQEVVRANRELAAYFKGRRTEREARAALKIIKAFVRERERQDPKSRPPLPGARQRTAKEPRDQMPESSR